LAAHAAARLVVERHGMPHIDTQPPLNPTWEHNAPGKLAQQEYAFQRMHRTPKAAYLGAPPLPDQYATASTKSFPDRPEGMPPSATSTARYTVGTKNALGTHVNYKQVTLDQVKMSSVHLGEDSRPREERFATTFSSAFAKPNQSHATQGAGSMRGGMAPRLPFSEIERNFGSLTSEGTMPGADGKREGTSEQRAKYPNPGRQPLPNPTLTLGYANDIGTSVTFQPTPAILADMTHYSLGDEPRRYVTTAMSATAPHAPPASRPHIDPAGQKAPPGPSEVEQGFKQTFTSRGSMLSAPGKPTAPGGYPVSSSAHFNILTNGPRLMGENNSDAMLFARNSAAHERPVGRKQHPTVNPADRGPSGMRETYDIITGADRPRERW